MGSQDWRPIGGVPGWRSRVASDAGAVRYRRSMKIRTASPDDITLIAQLIRELAEYERAPELAQAREADLSQALFGAHPHVFCHLAELDGVVIGMALWFLNFSTWLGRSGMYLEDLYVRTEHRGKGAGGALMKELARTCLAMGYERFEWSVLNWNTPSIDFYVSIGARPMDEWTTYRLDGHALEAYVQR